MSVPASGMETKRSSPSSNASSATPRSVGSEDGRFEHAYVAALTLATVIVRAHDERIHAPDHHRLTFERFGQLVGGRWANLADYLQHCRRRRNTSMYDIAGTISAAEAYADISATRTSRRIGTPRASGC